MGADAFTQYFMGKAEKEVQQMNFVIKSQNTDAVDDACIELAEKKAPHTIQLKRTCQAYGNSKNVVRSLMEGRFYTRSTSTSWFRDHGYFGEDMRDIPLPPCFQTGEDKSTCQLVGQRCTERGCECVCRIMYEGGAMSEGVDVFRVYPRMVGTTPYEGEGWQSFLNEDLEAEGPVIPFHGGGSLLLSKEQINEKKQPFIKMNQQWQNKDFKTGVKLADNCKKNQIATCVDDGFFHEFGPEFDFSQVPSPSYISLLELFAAGDKAAEMAVAQEKEKAEQIARTKEKVEDTCKAKFDNMQNWNWEACVADAAWRDFVAPIMKDFNNNVHSYEQTSMWTGYGHPSSDIPSKFAKLKAHMHTKKNMVELENSLHNYFVKRVLPKMEEYNLS